MPPRRLDPREISDLSDTIEEWISEKMSAKFRYKIALMKSDMIIEVVSALSGVSRHMGTKDGYEEASEDFEVFGSIGEDRSNHVERPIRISVGQFS